MHSALRPLLGLVLLSSSVLFPAPVARAQEGTQNGVQDPPQQPDGPRKRAPDNKRTPKDYSPAFLTLSNAWKGAFTDYSTALLRFDRANAALPPQKRDPKGPPAHPAPAWWKRFDDLGRTGDPDALEWLVEQSANAFAEPAQRAEAAEQALGELLRTHPDHRTVEDALGALRPLYESFGRERFVALISKAHEQARGSENQARALVLKAWAISDRFKDLSPERQHDVQQLYDEVLLVHPGTRAAREVAGKVFAGLEREFLKAQLDWIDAVRELQKQGQDPKQWPRQPMHAWYDKYLPIAAAGGPEASAFVDHVYPGYQQAEGNGIGFGLVWLQGWWTSHPQGNSDDGLRARLGVVEIVARQFHGQPLVTSALVDLSNFYGALPLKYLEPALAPVLADDTAPKAQALALWIRALAHSQQNQWSDWQAARADVELLLQKFPAEDIAARAQALLASMSNVWPGKQAPDFRGTDQDGLAFKLADYTGFVCVIDFASATGGFGAEEIARRRERIQSFAGRPFRWIGGVLDSGNQRAFHESLGPAGVNWRCALLGSRQSDIPGLWSIQVTPAIFVVDSEGVIRARNLPWDEQQALIEKLVSEAEKKRAKH
jgi:hypothetical protein